MVVVNFNDPIVNENIQYYLDNNLKPRWENLSKQVIKYNMDRVYIVVGKERSGKSTWTFQQAKFIDNNFGVHKIAFTGEEFLELIKTSPPGSVVVFDEAFRGFSSRNFRSKMNQILVQAMMEVGKKNLIIFIVLPSFALLEWYMATHRSHGLFYIYQRRDKKYRGWRGYNEKKKAFIYDKIKKNYGIFPFVKTKLRGQFFAQRIKVHGEEKPVPYTTFDLLGYEKKKDKAFDNNTLKEDQTNPSLIELNELKYKLSQLNFPIKSKDEFSKGLDVAQSTVRLWRRYGNTVEESVTDLE